LAAGCFKHRPDKNGSPITLLGEIPDKPDKPVRAIGASALFLPDRQVMPKAILSALLFLRLNKKFILSSRKNSSKSLWV